VRSATDAIGERPSGDDDDGTDREGGQPRRDGGHDVRVREPTRTPISATARSVTARRSLAVVEET
jgi:hypothetical protein